MPPRASCPTCSAPLPPARPGLPRPRCPRCTVGVAAEREPRSGLGRGELSRDERIEANRQIAQAMRFISALRGVYGSIAVTLGLALLIALLSTGPSAALRAALGLAFATAVAGALYVERAPLPWSLSLALAYTALHALLLLFGEGARVNRDIVVGSVFVAACWTAFGMARHAERIARAHPELRMARRLRGRTIEDELGVVSTKYRDRARAESRARRRRVLVIAGSVVAVLATVVFLAVHSAGRSEEAEVAPLPPPPFAVDWAVGKFRDAWNANRLDLVKEMFVPEWRAQYGRILDRHVERRGWKPLPTLPPPRMAYEGRFAAAYFALATERGDLFTSWAYDEPTKSWLMNRLRPPND